MPTSCSTPAAGTAPSCLGSPRFLRTRRRRADCLLRGAVSCQHAPTVGDVRRAGLHRGGLLVCRDRRLPVEAGRAAARLHLERRGAEDRHRVRKHAGLRRREPVVERPDRVRIRPAVSRPSRQSSAHSPDCPSAGRDDRRAAGDLSVPVRADRDRRLRRVPAARSLLLRPEHDRARADRVERHGGRGLLLHRAFLSLSPGR